MNHNSISLGVLAILSIPGRVALSYRSQTEYSSTASQSDTCPEGRDDKTGVRGERHRHP